MFTLFLHKAYIQGIKLNVIFRDNLLFLIITQRRLRLIGVCFSLHYLISLYICILRLNKRYLYLNFWGNIYIISLIIDMLFT